MTADVNAQGARMIATSTINGKPTPVAIEAELLSAGNAAKLCSISIASWWRLHAAGRTPSPLKLGGRTLWRTIELKQWITAGCPDRREWQARMATERCR